MKKYVLEIEQDEHPFNPRHDENVTTMICFHKRYELGDKHDYKSDNFDSWDELKEQIMKDNNVLMIKPLFMYEHSGITISTGSFGCQWDSGQIGWVFVDESKLKTICGDGTYSDEEVEEFIEGETKLYDQYLLGDVWVYNIYEIETCDKGHEHKELVESCGGFYGHDECMSEGSIMLKNFEKILELG